MGFDYGRRNKRWRRLRQQALRRDGYRCREAARFGRIEEATHVHHIWPAEDYPEYAYCLWNLVSLSQAAHDAMHDRISRELTTLGVSWRRRTPPPSGPEEKGSLQLGGEPRSHTAEKFPAGKNARHQDDPAYAYGQDAEADRGHTPRTERTEGKP